MDLFRYTPLDDPSASIRLLILLQGEAEDILCGEIRHEILTAPPISETKSTEMKLRDIRRSLPTGWAAYETLDDRIIFYCEQGNYTSWTHPNPEVRPAQYDLAPDVQDTSSHPSYEALSYAWGSTQKNETIFLNTGKTTRQLPVTTNLFIALRHLRYRDRPRTLWVDAVCIDQENRLERGQQVQRIGQIFSLAKRVIIWLGPGSDDSELALATVINVGQQFVYSQDRWIFRPPDGDKIVFRNVTNRTMEIGPIDALRCLYSRGYFARLWVAQEVHAGCSTVVVRCGDTEVPWVTFRYGSLAIHLGLPSGVRRPASSFRVNRCETPVCSCSKFVNHLGFGRLFPSRVYRRQRSNLRFDEPTTPSYTKKYSR